MGRRRARMHAGAAVLAVALAWFACGCDYPLALFHGAPVCGDGIVQQGEQCDDGNTLDGDGCTQTCAVARCGDGVLQGLEECDDGNRMTESCRYGESSCVVCDRHCRLASGRTSYCGDSRLDAVAGEECDDGTANSDAAPGACRTDCRRARCGDGVQDGGEQCDDGVGNSDTAPDACRADCRLARCGDGVVDSGEDCDDGDDTTDACPDGPAGTCSPARCGDGLVWNTEGGSETCDDGPDNGTISSTEAYCDPDCAGEQLCGNGVREGSEVCDGEGDWCTGACTVRTKLALGLLHTCGLRRNGTVACWGMSGDDDCRNGVWRCGQTAAPPGLFIDISSTSNGSHTCALRPSGLVECWGADFYDQATPPSYLFRSVSAGLLHTCGIRADGIVTCWGYQGGGTCSPPPDELIQISAGTFHTCGVSPTGLVLCWGPNGFGQASPPGGELVDISSGGMHTCGLRRDATVECWGAGLAAEPCDPFVTGKRDCGQAMAPAGTFAQVSSGGWHSCGLKPGGAMECWGYDGFGQATPAPGTFVEVVAGSMHTCGITTDGAVACWGAGERADDCDPEVDRAECGQAMVPVGFP